MLRGLNWEIMMLRLILMIALVGLVACGDDDTSNENGSAENASTNATTGNNTSGNSATSPNATTNNVAPNNTSGNNTSQNNQTTNNTTPGEVPEVLAEGTARETPVFVPEDYDASGSYPLVILLHGYTASGFIQDQYFGISDVLEDYDFIFLRPDGTMNANGQRFWNATSACCDFANSGVDDEGYLVGLIDEAIEKLAVDPKRVYLVGHSNGGFMSYRMACNQGDKIAAIVSLAGANFSNPAECDSEIPVAVAQAHGTIDGTIPYDGNQFVPSSSESVEPWASRNGCDATLAATDTELDLDSTVAGFETVIEQHATCSSGFAVERWTMTGSGHIPTVTPDWATTVMDFLYQFERP